MINLDVSRIVEPSAILATNSMSLNLDEIFSQTSIKEVKEHRLST